jgi:hypothetical protein
MSIRIVTATLASILVLTSGILLTASGTTVQVPHSVTGAVAPQSHVKAGGTARTAAGASAVTPQIEDCNFYCEGAF